MTGISAESQRGLPDLDYSGSFIAEEEDSILGCIELFKFERPGWLSAATEEVGPVNSKPQALKRASTMSRNLVLFMSSRVSRESSFPDLSKTKYLDSEFRDSFAMKYGT